MLKSSTQGTLIMNVNGLSSQVFRIDNLAPIACIQGGSSSMLRRPRAIASAEGRLYVSDYERFRIAVFSLTGEFMFNIGGRETSVGRLHSPFGIAIFGSRLIVAEGTNCDGRPCSGNADIQRWERMQRRLRVLSLDGAELHLLRPLDPMSVEPRGLCASGGHLYLADKKGHTIHIFSFIGWRDAQSRSSDLPSQ